MKISRVDVYGYDLSYVHGRYVMSGGRVIETLPSTVVRVTTEDGVEGFGEVCPLGPAYLPSHGAGARAALGELAPAVIGLSVSSIGAVNAAMDRALMGHGYAKSAIDTACWDALGRTVGLPVCDLLGGRVSDTFPLYFAVPLGSVEEMTAYVQARREEGIHRFQLKIGADPYEDAARTRSVVEATGPEDIIVADANGGWRLQDAVVAARAIDGLERVFFEQPCPTLEECLIVRQRTTLPMVLDECIRDVHSLLRAYQANAMEAFNLKISKVGGLTQAKLMRDLAVALGSARDDRGRLGRRSRHRGRLASCGEHAARDALHGLVHERLDERARCGLRAEVGVGFRLRADAPGPRDRRRRRGARHAALLDLTGPIERQWRQAVPSGNRYCSSDAGTMSAL